MTPCYFFGSFDPITNAHLELAKAAQKQFAFQDIVLVPAYKPPHKQGMAFFADRLQMCRLAVQEYAFQVSDIESQLEGFTYTINVLRSLQPDFDAATAKIPFIIGSDALQYLGTWFQADILAEKLIFLQAARETTPLQESVLINGQEVPLDTRMINWHGGNTSSTQVREMVATGNDISQLVPPLVAKYIKDRNLYKNGV